MSSTVQEIKQQLSSFATKENKISLSRFFKNDTHKQKDTFIGVKTPAITTVAKNNYKQISLQDLEQIIRSEIHEERMLALKMLVMKYEKESALAKRRSKIGKEKQNKTTQKQNEQQVQEIVDTYIKNLDYVNNWDLVDVSCYKIIGNFLLNKTDRGILYKFSKSKNLWTRRVALVSTMAFIKSSQFQDVVNLCEELINDKEEMVQKALGWMLKEMGKIDKKALEDFLNKNKTKMTRLALRYSIENFSKEDKKRYLSN